MTTSGKSLKNRLKTVGRLPKFLALVGAISLMLPVFSFAASAATARPTVVATASAHVTGGARTGETVITEKVPVTALTSKLSANGVLHTSTRYSAMLRSRHHHGGVTSTTTHPVVAKKGTPTTSTTVVASPTRSTTVAPTTTTTVAPTSVNATASSTTTTTTVPSGSPQPVGNVAGPWNLTFDSEFNGTSLNTTQWSTGWFESGITKGVNSAETECMDPAQVSVTGGALNLTAIAKTETCGGVTQPYASGMVTTNGLFSFTYGYMEARIWLPGSGSISDWPAFWADGQNWPTTGEIDVMEGLGGQAQAHFHDTAGALGPLSGTGSYTGGWHTFAADWEPGSITYYYDGVDIGSFTSGVTSAPMYLILDLATNTSVVAPATMKVDYVRVWQH